MTASLAQQLGRLLMTYAGPEPDRVRTAIAVLAKDDPEKMAHDLERARRDYRDVLWWAELQEAEERQTAALRGMTVNERLSYLELFPAWEEAVAKRDFDAAAAILLKCAVPDVDIPRVIEAEFRRS